MKIDRICETCGGIHIVKAGLSKSNYQLYQCQDCKHKFTETGLKIGRQKINFNCTQCQEKAVAKGLCRKCYTKSLNKIKPEGTINYKNLQNILRQFKEQGKTNIKLNASKTILELELTQIANENKLI